MKSIVIAAAAAASTLALSAAPAVAQDAFAPTFYGNLGYTMIDAGSGVDLGAISGRLGARLHKHLGVEAEGAIGVDADHRAAGLPIKTQLKHEVAAYAVGFLPLTPQVELFARGGYGSSRFKVSTATASVSDSLESWNYGAGAQYTFDGKNGVRAEYTRYDFNNNNGSADAWTVSYVRQF